MSSLGANNLSKSKTGDGGDFMEGFDTETKKMSCNLDADDGSTPESLSTESLPSRDHTPNVLGRSRLQNGESSSEAGHLNLSGYSEGLRSSEVCTPEMKTSYDCENPKESESPRSKVILRVTNAPRKRYPDIKSFSHELTQKA